VQNPDAIRQDILDLVSIARFNDAAGNAFPGALLAPTNSAVGTTAVSLRPRANSLGTVEQTMRFWACCLRRSGPRTGRRRALRTFWVTSIQPTIVSIKAVSKGDSCAKALKLTVAKIPV
jgi:hypothetical protein